MSETLFAARAEAGSSELEENGGKRRQILDGARKVFLASGFDAASMNEIARVAGVSKGTLYVYFDSKEALFEVLVRLDKRAQAEQLCRVDEEADLRTALKDLGFRLIDRMLEPSNIAHFRTVIAVASKFPRVGQAYYEAGPRFGMDRLQSYLRRHVDLGHLAIDDFEAAAHHFGDLCKSRYVLRAILAVDERPSEAELKTHIDRAVDVFLAGYASKA